AAPPAGAPLSVRWLYPAGYGDEAAARKAFDEIWLRIQGINQDAAGQPAPGEELLSDDQARRLPARLAATLRSYGWADALSIHFQVPTPRTLAALPPPAFIAAAALQSQPLATSTTPVLRRLHTAALRAA